MTFLDGAVLVAYALASLAIGLWAGRGHATSDDLLLGGRRLSTWVVATSMVATELSAATFIGVPQAAYTGDWSYLQLAFGALLGKLVVARHVVPLYHRLAVTTVYGLLEHRFGPRTRRAAAISFIGGRILASGVRLFIAALAFSTVADLRIEASIAVCGLLAGSYTLAGGIRAVIYTDVLQAGVLTAGAACLVAVLTAGPEGYEEILAWARAGDRSQIFHTAPWFSLTDGRAFGTAIIGGFFLTLATHSTDHDMVQRLLTTRDGRSGGRAVLASALLNFPLTLLFLFIGTGIAYTWASPPPDALDADRVLPLFVIHELPAGARGLVFAGLFAAAMSSLDSAICAIAATFSVDVAPGADLARRTRRASAVLCVVLIAVAIGMAHYQAAAPTARFGLVELALSSMTILYGGLLGIFALAIGTKVALHDRAGVRGLVVGATSGALLFLHPIALDATWIAWTWWIPLSASFAIVATLFPLRRR